MSTQPLQKRILIWSASYAPVPGGLQTIVAALAQGLQKSGHTIHILSNKLPSTLPSAETIEGIPVSRYRFFHPLRPVRSFKEAFLAAYGILIFPVRLIQLIIFIRRFKPAVVNVHFPGQQVWFLGILQQCFRKSKWIISLHGDEILQFFDMNNSTLPPAVKQKLSVSEKIKLRMLKRRLVQSNGITACSAWLMNMTGRLFNTGDMQGWVVYNGIDYALYTIPRPALLTQEYIFACGRLAYVKGFDMLISAYALLPEMIRSRYSLVIAGAGVEKEKLLSLAIQLRVHNRVRFYGRTEQPETIALLQHSALTVIPSRRETFGIVLLEAMAAGARVLATNVGGIPEIAPYGHVQLCEPHVDSIARGINTLLADKTGAKYPVPSSPGSLFSKQAMLEKYEELLLS